VLQAQGGQAALAAALRNDVRELDQLHALLVQRGDDLLMEEAPRGRGLDRAANIKSCSKSLLALVLGAAIARGQVPGLDARLAEIAPDLVPQDATEGAGDLTLEHLVTLRGGLQGTSGQNYGAWVASRNWVGYALRQPRIAPNGGRMIYSTGTTHVLGAALATATGQSLRQMTRDWIGTPLGIDIPEWTRDPQGFYFGGNEMALTPRAMLRVAVMLRDGGRFDGQAVLPEAWIAQSRVARTASPFSGLGYGLGWFLSASGWMIARGYGGQVIAAHPERALAVAITSDPTRPARSEGYFGTLMRLLDDRILGMA
jgi:CubicO group peptidase (beta-lactamase class C family)